jgi:hypothetical protein
MGPCNGKKKVNKLFGEISEVALYSKPPAAWGDLLVHLLEPVAEL